MDIKTLVEPWHKGLPRMAKPDKKKDARTEMAERLNIERIGPRSQSWNNLATLEEYEHDNGDD